VLEPSAPAAATDDLGAWVETQIQARADARKRRDFAAADGIRKELQDRGVVLEDTKEGVRWKKA